MDGTIDHLGRPIIRLETPPPNAESILCLLDTGFNRYLLLEHSAANRLGFQIHDRIIDQIMLGDGSVAVAKIARGTIMWFGSPMTIDAHVVPDAPRSRYLSPEHRIDGMIGTALLEGLHVFLDFELRRLKVRRPDSP